MVEDGVQRTASQQGDAKQTYLMLLGLRIAQAVFALIAFAVMASVDGFDNVDKLTFLLAMGVILFALNLGWIVYLFLFLFSQLGQSLEAYITLVGFWYDVVLSLLCFGSACAAAPSGGSGTIYSKVAASAAMMFFASFLLMCSLGLVFYKEYSRKRL